LSTGVDIFKAISGTQVQVTTLLGRLATCRYIWWHF